MYVNTLFFTTILELGILLNCVQTSSVGRHNILRNIKRTPKIAQHSRDLARPLVNSAPRSSDKATWSSDGGSVRSKRSSRDRTPWSDWSSAGPNILQSEIVGPLYNQSYPGCWLGNRFYMVGDRWSPYIEPYGDMTCVKCQCAQVVKQNVVQLDGKVVCINIKKQCPNVACAKPVTRPNTCCPVCPQQDTSFEDQFVTDDSPTLVPNLHLVGSETENRGFSALLTGGGRTLLGERPVRTRAVAVLHIYNISNNSFAYAIRFSRLRRPVYIRITDGHRTTIFEQKIPKQSARSGKYFGKVKDASDQVLRQVFQHKTYVSMTTPRLKNGEIFGLLKPNTLANYVSFEALLTPPDRTGRGALISLFYETSSHTASFIIFVGDSRLSDDYVVTFEKDTEIVYQHILQVSPQKNQMVGQVTLDHKLSKQVARGRIMVRLTSRNGETMKGLLRPRLLRQGIAGTCSLSKSGGYAGFVLLSLQDNGRLRFKASFDVLSGTSIKITLQRELPHQSKWRDFAELVNITTQNSGSLITAEGIYKKLRARDTVLLLHKDIRIKFTIDGKDCFSTAQFLVDPGDDFMTAGASLLRSSHCDTSLFVLHYVTDDCSGLRYHILSQNDSTTNVHRIAIQSVYQDFISGKGEQPSGTITGIERRLFGDLNQEGATIRITISDDICDDFQGKVKVKNGCWRSIPATTDKPKTDRSSENELEIDDLNVFRCYYNGQVYAHAHSWLPDDDENCVTCRCNRGNVRCDRVICPPTTCKYPMKGDGECCPVCNDDNETEQKHLGSCYYDGDKRWHPVGTYWHPYVPPFGYSKCALCMCTPTTLEVNCTRLSCPELACPKYQQFRLNPDDCCQVCRGINEASVISPIVSKSKEGTSCKFGENVYSHGTSWHPVVKPFGEMICYTCYCKNGKTRCKKQKCQQLECTRQYRLSGQCCPVCADKKARRLRETSADKT